MKGFLSTWIVGQLIIIGGAGGLYNYNKFNHITPNCPPSYSIKVNADNSTTTTSGISRFEYQTLGLLVPLIFFLPSDLQQSNCKVVR